MTTSQRVAGAAAGLLALGVVAAILLTVIDDDSRGEAVDPIELVGTSWQIVDGTGTFGRFVSFSPRSPTPSLEVPHTVHSPAVRFRFGESSLMGIEGCRDYTADYIIDGTSIALGNVVIDDTGCTSPDLRSAPFLDTIATATTIIAVDGLLQLEGPDGEMRFESISISGELREPYP